MPWDKIVEFALGSGPWGVLCLIIGFVAYDRDTRLRACQTARIEDAERRAETAKADAKALESVLQTSASSSAALATAVQSRTEVMAGMTDAISGVVRAVTDQGERIEELQDALTPRRKS